MLLLSNGWRQGIPQCTGQLFTTKNYPASNVSNVEVEKPRSSEGKGKNAWLLEKESEVKRGLLIFRWELRKI